MYKPRAVVRLMQRLGSFAAQIRRASYSQRFAAGKVYGRLPYGEGCSGATAVGVAPVEYGVRTVGRPGYRTGYGTPHGVRDTGMSGYEIWGRVAPCPGGASPL